MAVYLDTSAFDHLYRKLGCTAADIANLRRKIYGRDLSLLLSIHTLEEILLDRRARPEERVARIKLTLSLANFRRMVKAGDQLLLDDLRSYAATGEPARPFIDADLQNVLSDGLSELIETDGEELDEDLIAALEQTRARKQRFHAALLAPLAAAPARASAANPSTPVAFAEFYAAGLTVWLTAFLEQQGLLQACAARGLEALFGLRSVRMMVGLILSFDYERLCEPDAPRAAAPLDLFHAVAGAAATDTIVTPDSRLRRLLSRVPLDGLEVLDLPTFLRRVV